MEGQRDRSAVPNQIQEKNLVLGQLSEGISIIVNKLKGAFVYI